MQSKNLGLVSAILGSACCVGPALLAFLGVFGFAGGFFSKFHWEFVILGSIGVTGAWWQFLRERRQLQAVAARMRNERITRAILVFSTLVIVGVLGTSIYPLVVRGASAPVNAASGAPHVTSITLPVSGMDCAMCAIPIKSRLHRIAGVSQVDVNVTQGTVSVNYDSAKVKPEQLVAAIDSTGYKATLPTQQ